MNDYEIILIRLVREGAECVLNKFSQEEPRKRSPSMQYRRWRFDSLEPSSGVTPCESHFCFS